MAKLKRILIVGDDLAERNLIRDSLEERGFAVTALGDSVGAVRELLKANFDLVVMNLATADDSVELTKQIRGRADLANTLLLVIAEWGTGQASLALAQGADAFEPWPIEADRLISAIDRMLHQHAAAAERGT
jgi:two-component system phosphate regulon response regulator OmpR